MTKREALTILIRHAARDIGGVGCGVRPEIDEEAREKVRQAIKKLWREVYNFPIADTDLWNLGL